MVDLKYHHGTDVHLVRASYHEDATDLVAIAGDKSVEVIQCAEHSVNVIASFYLGLRPTAIAWSPQTISPTSSDDWSIELAISTHDFGLHLLTKSHSDDERVFHFGGGLTGHHGRINDLSFVGGRERVAQHLASVSDDKNLIVWDLYPSTDHANSPINSPLPSQSPSGTRAQPTALVIPFAHPLTSVSSHPLTSKEFIVSDCRGSVFLTDWRKDPNEEDETWHHIVELVHPTALAKAATNRSGYWTGCASWRRDSLDLVGAVHGPSYALWDISNLRGGKPFAGGVSFPEGGHRFRWCPTLTEYFAMSTKSPIHGAAIHLYNVTYPHAQPIVINLAPQPQRVLDFDWIGSKGIPRLACAVGHDVYIFPISTEDE
ncbi:hypothetical protein BD410DRAFT_142541 [Rickenella mellea]|uniref:Uncharacterized protein n=1 Tax=Rickenella mellea TaxID=50990 RepID=A0A4Y7Q8I5_9AGAM|nr:hypothetical protein BD410DRAFT_142541 [Rickenella mellea]